ncbi:alpha/beta fold hydrolase [Pelagibacterium mangrovi]|uniref:alpha/beta fold hydrolase n=1 Tax=Pelagibacterium mangrovi TaxID=3119828 RepID=UPI002FC6D332
MFNRAKPLPEALILSDLPVRMVTCGWAGVQIAVHIHGTLTDETVPVICIPGYLRNMADFADLPAAVNQLPGTGFAFVLIDLPGRGRSSRNPRDLAYSTLQDADCVIDVLNALDIARAVLIGEGHGGQVAMLAAARHPTMPAGTVLVDSGPVADSRGLVRMRTNFRHLTELRGPSATRSALHKILGTDYPGETEARLDALAERVYVQGQRGRLEALFDSRLIEQLEQFEFDDVLEPQWRLFGALAHSPLMIVRTQLSDQLRRATFEEMVRLRPDAATLLISGQGSPALLDGAAERDALAQFLIEVCRRPLDEE